jgi:hypothetical protein
MASYNIMAGKVLRDIRTRIEEHANTTAPITAILELTIETNCQENIVDKTLKQQIRNAVWRKMRTYMIEQLRVGVTVFGSRRKIQFDEVTATSHHWTTQTTYHDVMKARIVKEAATLAGRNWVQVCNDARVREVKISFLISQPLVYLIQDQEEMQAQVQAQVQAREAELKAQVQAREAELKAQVQAREADAAQLVEMRIKIQALEAKLHAQ